MQTLPALNIQGIVGTPGAHIWDTWNTFELAPRPYLGRQLTFTAPTKCDPSAGHYSGHPSPLLGLNLRKFGDNLLIDFRDISSCIMDMSYQSWSRPSLCDSGLWSSLPEYWYATPAPNPPSMSPILSVLHDLYSASYSYSARYQWSLLSVYCLWWYIWSLLHVPDLAYIHKIMFSVFYSPFAFPSLQIFRMLNWAEDRGDHLAPANIGGHSKLIRLRTLQSGVSSFEMHLYWHPPTLEIPFICANISWIQCGG